MFKFVILLTLISRLPHEITSLRACTPNAQFLFNGRLCLCDNRGYLNEANCRTISRRQSCQPGQIIWHGCNQCICQENGYLLCSNSHCHDDLKPSVLRQGLSLYGLRCTPYRSYYINCSICVCPASGITNEAQCVNDVYCKSLNSNTDIESGNRMYCIPNVMYLSPCKQCLCPEHGYFDADSCIEKCILTTPKFPIRHCTPGTFYRTGCNICRCPNNSIADDGLCVSTVCNNLSLHVLRTDSKGCVPHTFTVPRCMYCDCSPKGVVNENACLEIDCIKANELGKSITIGKSTCIRGEMVPICTECFCTRHGQSIAKYCSTVCSYQNRLNILEIVLKDASDYDVIEKSQIKRVKGNGHCSPNSLYLNDNRYCLCPENGNTDVKFCTSSVEDSKPLQHQDILSNNIEINYNSPCEPNTFVEFDCNTCYCTKTGKIDPKWCTYDDCQAKRLIQESHKTHNLAAGTDATGICQAGAISKLKCNFCICPESGVLKEKACTQNDCKEFNQSMYNEKLTCEPLAYYEVDCNICYCPRDGIKNVAKCTKNQCEKSILRSESCVPGQLFSDGCNLCVCPPDGNKMGKACTNHVCPEIVSGNLLQLYDDVDNHATINHTRSLDHCFPGEEFVEECKLCICPELGLKMYATCESILCDEKKENHKSETTKVIKKEENISSVRSRRKTHDCFVYNVSLSAERKECTPGTVYIIRCKECICPYLGNINNFCRPLAKNVYCEQAFPYFNYLPMGRRRIKDEDTDAKDTTLSNVTDKSTNKPVKAEDSIQVKVKHEKHTEFKCEKPGTILDKCFICDCENGNIVIEEHCYKSDADSCADAKPTFLFNNKVDL